MKNLLLALLPMLFASVVSAQTALDWSSGTGRIQCPGANSDWTGSPVESCRVRLPSRSWSITVTCNPSEVKSFVVGVRGGSVSDAQAECDVSLNPGVYGPTSTPVSVLLPNYTAPTAPVLQ